MKLWHRTDGVLWEVVERHFDEAEFLIERWREALDEPDIGLEELAGGIEQRLFAHLAGLAVVGAPALERLYWPALLSPDVEISLALVASLGVLDSGEAEDCRRLVALLGEGEARTERWRGVSEALALSDRTGIEEWLVSGLGATNEGPRIAGITSALARRRARLDVGLVSRLLSSGDPDVLEAAAVLARSGDAKQLAFVAELGRHPSPRVVAAAVETALVRGVGGAIEVARYWAFEATSCDFRSEALLWMGVLGDPDDQRRLIALLNEPTWRRDALWALGFGGAVAAVEAVLPWLADVDAGALAGEVVTVIAGLPTNDESLWLDRVIKKEDEELLPLAEENLDIPLSLDPADFLPVPNPDAVAAWWRRTSVALDRGARLLGGEPLDDAVLERALSQQPMRRRHALGLLAEIRSQGARRIATRDWARTQLHSVS